MIILRFLPAAILAGIFVHQIIVAFTMEQHAREAAARARTPFVGPTVSFKRVILPRIIAFTLAWTMLSGIGAMPAGSLGVVTRGGQILTNRTIEPGFFYVMPLLEKVNRMSVQVQALHAPAEAVSKNLQVATTQVTLNYSLRPESVGTIFSSLGYDYVSRIIAPGLQEAVKATTAEFVVDELVTKREAVRAGIVARLRDNFAAHGIAVDGLSITNFAFAEEFAKSVEAKQVAEQRALQAANDLKRAEFDAKSRVAAAEGEARAIAIQAEAINKQGGADYVNLKAVEKWNGVLPQWITEGGATPFITVPSPQR